MVEQKTESNEFSVNEIQDRVIELEKERSVLKDDLVYIQSQSMRNNLVFVNIPEAPTETPEDSEKKVRDFIVDKLHLAQSLVDKIHFERVHRMGHEPSGSSSRNMVAKFTLFKDRELVRRQWKCLQGTDYYMYEQFPKEVVEKRRKLKPQLQAAKREGKKAWLSYDKLYIDGKLVALKP